MTVKRKYEDITDQPTYGATFRKANACCGCHHQCVSDRLRPRSRSMSSVRKPRSRAFDEDVDTESVRSLSTSDSISQTPLIDTPQLSMLEKLPVEVLGKLLSFLRACESYVCGTCSGTYPAFTEIAWKGLAC